MDLSDGHFLEQLIGSAVGGAVASVVASSRAFRSAQRKTREALRWLLGVIRHQSAALKMKPPLPPPELAAVFDDETTNPGEAG